MEKQKMTWKREDLIDFLIKKGNGIKGLSELKLAKIPDDFIQPPHQRLSHTKVATQHSIPIIDVSNWDDPRVSQSICAAAADWGFFQIINHGIPIGVLQDVKNATHDFFNLPVAERSKYLKENSPTPSIVLKTSFSHSVDKVLEWKDSLLHFTGTHDDGSHLWPNLTRDRVLEYTKLARPVIGNLVSVLLSGINVQQKQTQSDLVGSVDVSLLCYPKCPNPDLASGATPHSDVSVLTLLLQDDVGGLYVRASQGEDQWIHVEPMEGALIVNVGDVLEIMSNGKYKSIEHRVFLVSGDVDRVSVPLFVIPPRDALIGPLPEALHIGEKPIYRQIVFSDYFNRAFSKPPNGKQTIDYVRV
ncbi:bi-functional coumaroyl CoA and feruloyl CoA ortho-hydroxylase F6H2-2-1-like [Salvia miltiorrhiza]|uniref:bi-functional coumaroyl CoA and feruloyl CoA ortho-hydroxylase F6H2-2-1-like n=1 Tax=Salvia miltiorrhiza TaxID=226208 RepID=UPI0025AD2B31|nr:bi-functional coumaroyl CoA and feruloyl CoA ortho-hydroxylase F6H2-2-1-like [Salvia miltiorrhiza]